MAQSAIGLRELGLRVVGDDATFSPGEMHVHGLARLAGTGVEHNHAKGSRTSGRAPSPTGRSAADA